jgi:hypothetical protein
LSGYKFLWKKWAIIISIKLGTLRHVPGFGRSISIPGP